MWTPYSSDDGDAYAGGEWDLFEQGVVLGDEAGTGQGDDGAGLDSGDWLDGDG